MGIARLGLRSLVRGGRMLALFHLSLTSWDVRSNIQWDTKWDIHRYKRCTQVLLPAVGAKAVFLRLYALYLAGT